MGIVVILGVAMLFVCEGGCLEKTSDFNKLRERNLRVSCSILCRDYRMFPRESVNVGA